MEPILTFEQWLLRNDATGFPRGLHMNAEEINIARAAWKAGWEACIEHFKCEVPGVQSR